MLPHRRCIAPEWLHSDTNRYFVHDCSEIMRIAQPAVWCFGHTHSTLDITHEMTRMVCNPYGYPFESNNFNPHFTVEVPDA